MNLKTLDIKATGISLLCNMQGKIIELLCDEIGLASKIQVGQIFITVFDLESREKAANFLVELKLRGVTLDWPLSVTVDAQPMLLHFAGGMNGDNMFIVGTKTPASANQFFNELMKINNEQANKLREVIKQQVQGTRNIDNRDSQLYEELTQLNNELANAQRELTKKNMQLEQQRKELKQLNTELSSTIAELQQTRDELIQSEKMASLGRLVSGFAHEINTPIGVALAAASAIEETTQTINFMLNQEDVSETELVAVLEKLAIASGLTMSNLRRAAELVQSFKRTSIDQASETQRLFGLYEVIHDVIVSLDSKFKSTAITIEVECPMAPNLYSYPGVISQILTNFMLNSWIHGFDEGQML
ncbi:MAG: histidine kinase dimerization/phospho-acceptor domain-containing protein [Thiotrichaceae bacterium]